MDEVRDDPVVQVIEGIANPCNWYCVKNVNIDLTQSLQILKKDGGLRERKTPPE
jgi:hypothetical protein